MKDFAGGLRAVMSALAAWYREGHRELPWRSTRDPYTILLSEIMLQQTQVDKVIPYFERFLVRFPDVHSLAGAREEEVLKLWEGLGYYRRARHLLESARIIAAAGGWPKDVEDLSSLPGVGRSTAGAIASIAFGKRAPILDGNVKRVWCRLAAYDAIPQGRALAPLWDLSEAAVEVEEPDVVNQALMELGATICRRTAPACTVCPVKRWCRAFAEGRVEELPLSVRRSPRPVYDVSVAILQRGDRFLVTRRKSDGFLGGLWELPGGKWEDGEDGCGALHRELAEELGVQARILKEYPPVRHAYTHFEVVLHPFVCELLEDASPATALPMKWIRRQDVASLAFPSGTLKVFAGVFKEDLKRVADGEGEWNGTRRADPK